MANRAYVKFPFPPELLEHLLAINCLFHKRILFEVEQVMTVVMLSEAGHLTSFVLVHSSLQVRGDSRIKHSMVFMR